MCSEPRSRLGPDMGPEAVSPRHRTSQPNTRLHPAPTRPSTTHGHSPFVRSRPRRIFQRFDTPGHVPPAPPHPRPPRLLAPSEAALHLGLALASRFGAVLHLVHVEVLSEDPYGTPDDAAGPGARLRERLKAVVDRDRDAGQPYDPESVKMEHAVVRGVAAAPAILQYADAHDVDLVVMGRHGRRGLQRTVLGSVAEAVVLDAPCPVVTVPAGYVLAGESPSVLVAVDFSAQSATAVEVAARLAAWMGADLDVLHVVETVGRAPEEAPEEAARARLTALSASVLEDVDDAPAAVRHHVVSGRPGDGVMDVVRETAPALLVVGPRGHAGLGRLLGSVADRAVREAPCPVVVSRPSRGARS